jgi:hypothetical protein
MLVLLLCIGLSLPIVQTKIGHYVTDLLQKDYGAAIQVEEVSVSIFGNVKFKNVLIKDHKKDTLIFSKRIQTDILSFSKLYNGDLLFGSVTLNGLIFNMKTYKGEKLTNIDLFIALFDTGKPSTKKFLLKAKNIYLEDSRFILIDENRKVPKDVDFSHIQAKCSNFVIHGPDVTTKIQKMAFVDYRGIEVKELKFSFTYTKKFIKLESLKIKTASSSIEGDIVLNYDRKDFSDFNNKVLFDVRLNSADISSNDIRYFYKEIGKNQHFKFTSKLEGTLNNFTAVNLDLVDYKGSEIKGTVNFKNIFGTPEQAFKMKGDFKTIASNYKNLTELLPSILGKKLPTSIRKLGRFELRGKTEVSATSIDANFYMKTAIGNIQTNLEISNIDNSDQAIYIGNVILENFNIGGFLNKKELGTVTLNIDVDGKGFKEEYLNTHFKGDIYRLKFKGYNYSNISVNGHFEKPNFQGKIIINDPNLFLDFEGIATIGKQNIDYDFKTKVDYANLSKLKLVATDSVSVFKGGIDLQLSGTTLDNLKGSVSIAAASYQNYRDTYYFDDLELKSSFDEQNIRTISILSPDIIEGKIIGKFKVGDFRKMIENSLGSLYANYQPTPVNNNQFLKFDFTVFSKIIEVFYPGITIGSNTTVNGSINATDNEFKFNLTSPTIVANENYFDNINIKIDNKNPLYNTFVSIDSIKSKYYKVSDFSVINVTAKDTLFIRSEFKGGTKATDNYTFNIFHTINKDNKNVVGIQKSELFYKNNLWFINEKEDDDENRVVFDKLLQDFTIENIKLTHKNQLIRLDGFINGKSEKELKLNFSNIDLDKLTPDIEQFKFSGVLDGEVTILQEANRYQPSASIDVDQLTINSVELGKLAIDIKGDENFKKFNINSDLINNGGTSFSANGFFNTELEKTNIDLDLQFENFNLGLLSSLGGDVITNVKGFATGSTRIEGDVNEPEVNGRIFLDKSALTIPYMNVTYELENKSVVDVTETSFIVRNALLSDAKYKTNGVLEGKVTHNKFSDWNLDLNLSSKRLLALDTKDSEDAAYFGTAFIDGNASITGPTNGLFIKVNAKSETGTTIKIPINDAEAASSNSFLRFLTAKEKFNSGKSTISKTRDYNGLELEFDLDINQNAEIEVILNRNSGHGMKGRGRGGLLLEINTLGKFNMTGDFQVYEGSYNFKYGGLINKKFEVKKLGSIVWEGDPMKAILNLEAVYKTAANPAVLLENPSINKKVPVEVVIGITGNLSNPEPDFKIDFPTISSVLKSEIQYKLDDKDTRQTQALFLLSSGGFLSSEGVSQSDLTVNLFERASGLFDDIFQDEEGKFNLGIDIVSADKRPGLETDGRFGVTVTTKVNDRITINGKLGVPIGGVNESAIVGNVEVLYRVNEDGTFNLRMFNKENDINYFVGQGIGYTQGVGLNYEVDFDTFTELVNRIFKKKKIERVKNNEELEDSTPQPDFIQLKSKEKKKTIKQANEAILIEED